MKLLFENWRKYLLNEVSFEQAKEQSLYGKATEKILKGYLYDLPGEGMPDFFQRLKAGDKTTVGAYNILLSDLRSYLLALIPNDIPEDSQKGQALLWVIRLFKQNPNLTKSAMLIGISDAAGQSTADQFHNIKKNLEIFFQQQRFMPEPDLNKIQSPEQLESVVEEARPAIEAHQKEQRYMNVEEGMEVFRNDSKWFITGVHNKGAACELGKGTDWCTAAPGLDYFGQYYESYDPLFFFEDKKTGERFQFHYGSAQFMDERDVPLEDEQKDQLHSLLKQTKAFEKYDVIQAHDDMIIASYSKDPQELEELAEQYADNTTETGIDIKKELITNKNATNKIFRIIFEKDKTRPTRKYLALYAREHDILMALANPENYDLRGATEPGPYTGRSPGDPKAFRDVMYSLIRNVNVSKEVIDQILNTANTPKLSHITGEAMRRMVDTEKTFIEGGYTRTGESRRIGADVWPGLTGEQILKIAKVNARHDGADTYVFRTLIYLIEEVDNRYIEEDGLMRKVLTIGASSPDPGIREAVARYEKAPLDILEKIAAEQLTLSVQMALVKNPNTSEEILNKIIDRMDNTLIIRDIAFRATGRFPDRKGPVPSEKILLRLLLLHQKSDAPMSIASVNTQRLVKAAGTALKDNYDYSIKDLAKILGEEYKEAVSREKYGETNPHKARWADILFDSHPAGRVYEQTEPFQKAVKKNYRKMKMRLIATGPNTYNVGGKMKKPSYKRAKSAPPGFGGSLEESE